jgi:hypothetical protein
LAGRVREKADSRQLRESIRSDEVVQTLTEPQMAERYWKKVAVKAKNTAAKIA